MLNNHVGQLPLVAEAANDLPIFCNDVWLGALKFAQQDQPPVDDENPADRCSNLVLQPVSRQGCFRR
jgi:hypothetical protein